MKRNRSQIENQELADDESEDPATREQAREKVAQETQQLDALGKERGDLEEGTSLRESKVVFIFRTVGSVISFLMENAWILIVGV